MTKPVVLVAEELSATSLAVLDADFEVRFVDGADRAALLPALSGVDALIVRSATQVDAEALAAAGSLQVVARAGIGLDNVDVPAATKAGVMVVNAPTSNVVSAAEHAVALLLSSARNIPQASASLKSGEWKRSRYTGVELAGKTVGIVGLGRIGVLVAQRLSAFGTRLIAYDPYVSPARAAQMNVRTVTLDELLAESDFITVHLPKTPETAGLIGDRELSLCKPEVRIVNAARGGIVDEAALGRALADGRVAGAALDVFVTEPCTESPLFAFDSVVVTPHLGASTHEAQERAGLVVAEQVALALRGEFVPNAVNVQAGGVVGEDVRPYLPLAERLGRLLTALAAEVPAALVVEARGELAAQDTRVLTLAALKGAFADVVEDAVSYVNAPLVADERGLVVSASSEPESPDYRSLLTLRATLHSGEEVRVSGTLVGPRQVERIVEVLGFAVELSPSAHLAFLRYDDKPGVVGTVGTVLGSAGVNIAAMQVGRREAGGEALMALTVDGEIPAAVLSEIVTAVGARSARAVDLT